MRRRTESARAQARPSEPRPAQARRPEPSWPKVIATTVRLWVQRHPVAALKVTGWRLLTLVAGAVLAVSAAIAAVAIGTSTTSTTSATSAVKPSSQTNLGSRIPASLQAAARSPT